MQDQNKPSRLAQIQQADQAAEDAPASPKSLRIINGLCLVFIVIIGFVMVFIPYTRVERVQGHIAAERGVIKIYAQENSVVLTRHVAEGETVRKGQPILTLTDERQLGSGGGAYLALGQQTDLRADTIRQEMTNIRSLYDAEQSLLLAQINRKLAESAQTKTNVDIQTRSYKLAKDTYKRKLELVDKGFISKEALGDEEQKLLSAEGSFESAKKELITSQAAVEELQANKAMLDRRREKELFPLSRALSTTHQESIDHAAKKSFVIIAPDDGIVSTILPKPGDTVLEKELLVSISPVQSNFQVNLYVPSSAIGFLQKKAVVRVRYNAYPYHKFGEYGAIILNISSTALSGAELKIGNSSAESYYRVQAQLNKQTAHADGREFALHEGMDVQADIEVETRKIIEWILEPIYSLYHG